MDVCRVCLSKEPDKDIHHLKTTKKEGNKSPSEIMHFCLGILLDEDSKITKKLCTKCFKKIVAYYKFKSMALRSDMTLKSATLECSVKLEPLNLDYECDDRDEDLFNVMKGGTVLCDLKANKILSDVKEESNAPDFDSDDEILGTLKRLKSEDVETKSGGDIFAADAVAGTNNNIKELFDSENDQYNIKSEKETRKTRVTTKRHKRRLTGEAKPKRQRKSRAKPRDSNGKIIGKIYKNDWKYRKEICEECGKSVKNLKEHMMTHLPEHLKKVIPCKYPGCDLKFGSFGVRYKHYKRVHLRIKDHCDICNKDYTSLPTHIKQVHQQELMAHKCMFCEKRFISQSALDVHVGMHTKSRPHACEHCGKLYRTSVCLRNHIRAVHNQERSHMCQFCDKKFFKKCHLEDHMRKRVHLKEKHYTCEYCSKDFYGKGSYKQHLRSHTKEKPYACKICDMRFGNSTTLKNHTATHRTTKDFHCEICSMSFTRVDYLRVHMRTHTKEKRYPCKYCGVSFGRSDHRKRHQFTAHEKNMPYVGDRQSRLPQDDDSRERMEDDTKSIPISIEDTIPAFDGNSVDSA